MTTDQAGKDEPQCDTTIYLLREFAKWSLNKDHARIMLAAANKLERQQEIISATPTPAQDDVERVAITDKMIDHAVEVSFPWAFGPHCDEENAKRVLKGKEPREWEITRDQCRAHTRKVLEAALTAMPGREKSLHVNNATSIRIVLEDRPDGGLRVYSDDVPGLILSGSDPAKVASAIWPALAALRGLKTAPLPPDREAIARVKVKITNIGTRSDDYLDGFQAGVRAHVDAVSALLAAGPAPGEDK